MAKVFVKIASGEGFFQDPTQPSENSLTGSQIGYIERTAYVDEVIRQRGLDELQPDNPLVKEYLKENPGAKPKEEKIKGKYDSLTKAELNAELDKREIAHEATSNNPTLIGLLESDDASKEAV